MCSHFGPRHKPSQPTDIEERCRGQGTDRDRERDRDRYYIYTSVSVVQACTLGPNTDQYRGPGAHRSREQVLGLLGSDMTNQEVCTLQVLEVNHHGGSTDWKILLLYLLFTGLLMVFSFVFGRFSAPRVVAPATSDVSTMTQDVEPATQARTRPPSAEEGPRREGGSSASSLQPRMPRSAQTSRPPRREGGSSASSMEPNMPRSAQASGPPPEAPTAPTPPPVYRACINHGPLIAGMTQRCQALGCSRKIIQGSLIVRTDRGWCHQSCVCQPLG